MKAKPSRLLAFAIAAFSVALSTEESYSETSFQPLGQSSYRFDWTGEDGVTVIPQWSTDLVNWFYLGEIDQGFIHDPIELTPLERTSEGEYVPLPSYFMRLAMSDYPTIDPKGADFDGDGLSNWMELTIYGTDPLKSDTYGSGFPDGQEDVDSDGMSDQWERMLIAQSADPASMTLADIGPDGDFDNDGVTNLQEYLHGTSGYQSDTDGDGYSDRLSYDQQLYLRLDETTGAVAADASGKKRNGILASAPTWQASGGIEGGALEFHGTDAVELPAEILDAAGDLTVSLWFKTSGASGNRTLLSSAGAAQAPEFAITLENGATIRIHTGGGQSVAWSYGRSLADDLWHHLVTTRDTVSGLVALHLDGIAVGSPQSVSLGGLTVSAFALGQRHQYASAYDSAYAFSGMLDGVRVHSVVLEDDYLTEMFRPNDLDQDGLPDDYEIAMAGNLTKLAGADADCDGDGLTNRQEFESGTDPTDYYNGQPPTITLFSGSGQSVFSGQRTPLPLVFLVTDGVNPLVGAPVSLSQLEQLGSLESLDGGTLATSQVLKTDSEGKVAVHFKAN